MQKKYILILIIGGVLFFNLVARVQRKTLTAVSISENALAGGTTTVFNTSREAFAKPATNLPTGSLRDFTFGNKLFNTKWVTAPASVTSLDGLGPTFNRRSCSGCHFKDGRGRPPRSIDEPMKSMLVRLSIPGTGDKGAPRPHPAYGEQLNDRAIQGVPTEGVAKIVYDEIEGKYADGTTYALRKPKYTFHELAFGPLGDTILVSPRVAPAVLGMGLLEAIPEAAILNWADPDDRDGDGISGRPNKVWDVVNQKQSLGRFGWKANVATVREQAAAAARGDIGITTTLFPEENCPEAQQACREAPNGGTPEMSGKQLEKIVLYLSTLAVPARRNIANKTIKSGATLFQTAKCASCHIPQTETGDHPIPALSHQKIQPFTDLLLHDMGEGLADNRPDFQASGREWRTPPLWGIGLVETVNKHTYFLHDGRARNLEEAILWHGGEAEPSKEMFRQMTKEERDHLIAFLKSL